MFKFSIFGNQVSRAVVTGHLHVNCFLTFTFACTYCCCFFFYVLWSGRVYIITLSLEWPVHTYRISVGYCLCNKMIKPPSASGYIWFIVCSTCAYDKHLLESSEVKSCSQKHLISSLMHSQNMQCFFAQWITVHHSWKSWLINHIDCKYCTHQV